MKHFLVFLFVAISLPSFSQSFQRSYGTANNEDAYYIDNTLDNGFILAGGSFGNGTGGTDAMLTKTDSAGNIQWSKVYGGTGNEFAIYVKMLPGGGYVFSGETHSIDPAGDAYIARTDANGNLLWWKNYGSNGYDIAYNIKPLADGTFITSGLTENASSSYDGFIMHSDANGDSLWTRTFSTPGVEDAVEVIPTSDNGFLFCGRMINSLGWSDIWLLKTDVNGDTLWSKTIGGPVWEEGMDVLESNGGYLICGGESSFGSGLYDVLLMKTDFNGNLLWSKTYGGPYIEDSYNIIEVPAGGYAISGYTESFGPGNIRGTDSSNAFVIRTDFNGDTLWSMSYGGLLKEECFSIKNTYDHGFAIGGYTESFGDSLNGYIFKADSMGYTGCNERRAAPDILTNPPFAETGYGVNVFRGMNKTVPVISVTTPPNIAPTMICPLPLAAPENIIASDISLFPNPSSGKITLQWNGINHFGEAIEISVYNTNGDLVYSEKKNFSSSIEINDLNLADGIYFFRVKCGDEEVSKREIIGN